MKNIVESIVKLAEKDRRVLSALKNIAINKQEYELCANIREVEISQFPKASTFSKEYEETKKFHTALRLIDIKCDLSTVFMILETAKNFIEKGEGLAVRDITKIQALSVEIFGE